MTPPKKPAKPRAPKSGWFVLWFSPIFERWTYDHCRNEAEADEYLANRDLYFPENLARKVYLTKQPTKKGSR